MTAKGVKKVKIVSNGHATGTFVYIGDNCLEYVEEIEILPMKPGKPVTAKITISDVELELKNVDIMEHELMEKMEETINKMASLSHKDLRNLEKNIQEELRTRRRDYLISQSKKAKISDKEVSDIVNSGRCLHLLPLSDYAKVKLAIIASEKALWAKGLMSFCPIVTPTETDEDHDVLFGGQVRSIFGQNLNLLREE